MTNVSVIASGKSEAERAAEHRKKVEDASVALCAAMDDALADGFVVNFSIAPAPPTMRHKMVGITVAKHY